MVGVILISHRSLWDRLSYFKKKKAGLLTNTPSTNSTMEKHSGSSLRHWSPEKIGTHISAHYLEFISL